MELIKSCKKGNREGYKNLYDKYQGQMYSICLRYCKDENIACDALQNGFISVFDNLSNLTNHDSLEFWMRKIMVRSSLELLRKEKKIKQVDIDTVNAAELGSNESYISDNYNYNKILEHLNSMPEGYRTIFSMHILDELSHVEIAEILNISVNTSRTQLFKARKYMQELIKNDKYLSKEIKYRV
ncbi:MAG: RNA polymerase sigma factor [Saprospiraceae bacterium]